MDAQYTVLARRFRPQTFSEVVGQQRVAQTLRNAIHEGRVAHAYLFTGARGVGKTSMARIFAKSLNCPNAKDGVPCNECEQCRSVSIGQDVDVSEIDGASNRGIDDIRALRANVSIKSMRSKYKIYIIDEVHMLTKEAFNALLKTLEEPPPGVKFIFCTTEPNKVPDTILSRCQRFDFGTISTDNIKIRLRQLAEAEGFQVEEEALELVARRAAGSMRDSQSLFDQLLAFGSEQITAADVHRLLGTAPDDRLIDMMKALIDRRPQDALAQLDAALSQGVQLESLTDQIIAYFRDLMVLAAGAGDVPLISVSSSARADVQHQAQGWGLQTVVAAMQILAEAKARMQRVTYARALAELGLVRISLLPDLDRLDDLIAQIRGGSIPNSPRVSSGAPPAAIERITTTVRSDAAQKKNDVTQAFGQQTGSSAALVSDFHSGSQVVNPLPAVEWKSGCGKELQELIADRLNDMTGTYVRRARVEAIVEPNELDFSFPANYDLERKALERPDVIGRLEQLAATLVGRTLRIRFRTIAPVESRPKANGVTAANGPRSQANPQRTQIVENPEDPFLQEISKTFGVKDWMVKEVLADPTGGEAQDPATE